MPKVVIRTDDDYEMYEIIVDGKVVDGGNFWDFNFPDDLENILEKVEVDVSTEDYNYEEEHTEEFEEGEI